MRVGSKLRSAVGTTEMVVVRAPSSEVVVTCGGLPMSAEADGAEPATGADSDILLGKRYTDEDSGIELLCSKPGPGPLAIDGRELAIKGPKPLPASD